MKNISLLGSTGSIGVQTVDVVRRLREAGREIGFAAFAAHSNIGLLESQIREFKPQAAAVFDLKAAQELKRRVADLNIPILAGEEGLCEAASLEGADLVLNGVTGMVGLLPTLAAVRAGKILALANKESLVTGGELVMDEVKKRNTLLLPVDSEHSAIFQCLEACADRKQLNRLILTASGGPFFGWSREELSHATPEMALKHPNWSMGARITVDSATMFNKGLEIIEAKWLFDVTPEQIDVVVHRESVVHSLIEFCDHSVLAQLGVPDMRIPIQYALTYPERFPSPVRQLRLEEYGTLSFAGSDETTFTCLAACKRALMRGGLAPAAINGADEEAVKLFLEGKLSFLQIGEMVAEAMERQPDAPKVTLEGILEADRAAREYVRKHS